MTTIHAAGRFRDLFNHPDTGPIIQQKLAEDPEFIQDLRKNLLNEAWAVNHCAVVAAQGDSDSRVSTYNPAALTLNMQQDAIAFWTNPPRTPEGFPKFGTILTARQSGKSTCLEIAAYATASQRRGWDHTCLADTRKRAEYLHKRVHLCHNNWPLPLRTKSVSAKETNQLTLEFPDGTKSLMRVQSANEDSVGLGQSPDSFHGSECGFWNDFSGAMNLIWPSFQNRKHGRVVLECTPTPLSMASGQEWRDHCLTAKNAEAYDRHFYMFYPYWDNILCRRIWQPTWKMTNEELNLLQKYGNLGLSIENLAFRREIMATDAEIRRDPSLFDVWYPSDDISCWISGGSGAIPAHIVDKIKAQTLVPRPPGALKHTIKPTRPDAMYVIGVDPCGFTGSDHGAYVTLEVWRGRWEVVTVFSGRTDPISLTNEILSEAEERNRALVVVESNGVGQAVLTAVINAGYPKLYYSAPRCPGVASTGGAPGQKMMADFQTALLDCLVINSEFLAVQIQTYKNDKITQESNQAETLRENTSLGALKPGRGRREKHHWDAVSACIMAVVGAMTLPVRADPQAPTQAVQRRYNARGERVDEAAAKQPIAETRRDAQSIQRQAHRDWIASLTPEELKSYNALERALLGKPGSATMRAARSRGPMRARK